MIGRHLLQHMLCALTACIVYGVVGNSAAQTGPYPNHTVTIIMPSTAGGASDTIARAFASKLAEIWGQPVVVENRPGAGGIVGTEIVARSRPDGYTLLLGFMEHAWMKYFPAKASFDVNTDLVPVSLLGFVPNVIALSNTVPANNVKEFIALAKANPGKYNFGSGGSGSAVHLFGELFKEQNKLDIVHVPYRGTSEANLAVVAGQIELLFPTALSIRPHAVAGKVKVLAVSAPNRLSQLPDVPTVAEAGIADFNVSIWYCIFAPAGTPKEIVAKINADLAKAGNSPDVRERLGSIGVQFDLRSPEQFQAFFRAEQARWSQVIENAKIKFQ